VKPLAIDLYCGLGGWAEGLLAENFRVIGFDIEAHQYGDHRYPAQLVIQDVTTLHGAQFRDAALIVASPPCQEFSYMAMPWSLAKAKARAIRADTTGQMLADLTRLFDACWRIQAQASLAAGRHIPMVVENVRGAQPWVGRARWNFGSFYLWGDVPALMPIARAVKSGRPNRKGVMAWTTGHLEGRWESSAGRQAMEGIKRESGGSWFGDYATMKEGIKQGGTWRHDPTSVSRISSSGSPRRREASALIAKIPLPLARHIAATYRP
jgi:C-5 cytosine-specific DNA methylase